ncbi:PWWP domain-containing DNA repair factor 3A isoform X2 [Pelobates fuscus]|uniref:PWWP domain-containing DNA repair factor 3A isoform X2 n=1 Tax=Pelobates fuscus TaxID=191477 RepID=UPI002FE4B01F
MSSPGYVFCKWHQRLWPAKVISMDGPDSEDSLINVEILCLDEQLKVKVKDTKPMEKTEIENIASRLVHKDKHPDTAIADLTYRKALRIALDILSQSSTLESSNHATLRGADDPNQCRGSDLSQAAVSEGTEIANGEKGQEKLARLKDEQSTPEKSRKRYVKTPKKQAVTSTTVSSETSTIKARSAINSSCHLQNKSRKRKRDSITNKEQDSDRRRPRKKLTHSASVHMDTPVSKRRLQSAGHCQRQLQAKIGKNVSAKKKCAGKQSNESTLHVPALNKTTKTNRKGVDRVSQKAHVTKLHKPFSESQTKPCKTKRELGNRYKQLAMPDFEEERGLTPSELSMEISSPENCTPKQAWSEEDPEDDEDLPSVLLHQGPESIEPGMFVWCKYNKYPYWPSLVKSVQKKDRKAGVLFVEHSMSNPTFKPKVYKILICKLKCYDCNEKQQLLAVAREYDKTIDWCDAIISDYRIRVGCGSFTGSFTEYCTSDISYPVHRELGYAQSAQSGILFPDALLETTDSDIEATPTKPLEKKKLLPDRTRASRDRANERLVEFIVSTKQAESHLLAILAGKKKSRWLQDFQASNRHMACIDTYMEDEEQVYLVVSYLQSLCEQMDSKARKLMNQDQMRFILDVLLPEAIICAISATDHLNYEKAEKKYLDGPSVSKRERNQFEEQILKTKLQDLEKRKTNN